ncbi:nucleoside 2-deoxyribosyltransferase [Paraburkholderia sp. 22099]|jgi:nucleoside 2-deoxyribosyltransferase|uniref:Nucleoside 2-deoxyribosyltransferase n=1 Tax=Paraburkholderia terricola TaxID=169427 RepID=A0ABU1LTR1_9BURK|nr:nucleoside 2-deoxyribosyltransferase [Paraburkholderia terricola]MDR6410152.1 nucleoside 2-deoxyribosyltransferase [Paraburkholderia terricola]MDR6481312.1 nucleoside 2-deoxyribosyltransferase [Paraburkholderia terricola]MDR6494893.1 nucleoside 2-deoxyribosyltransferase [Paraburkholderia terricola]
MPRAYCAGPLFNAAERAEMDSIARTLEAAGYATFLPHRDGLEFARLKPELEKLGASADEAARILDRAIFSLDTYQLLRRCDVVVANLNGRVADEGTVVEASLAWHAGKPLVLFKADARSMLGGSDNPMLTGLGEFDVIDRLSALPQAVDEAIARDRARRVEETLSRGAEIASLREGGDDMTALAKTLYGAFRNAIPT